MDAHNPHPSIPQAGAMSSMVSARHLTHLPVADLLRHVGGELYRVGLTEIGRVVDGAPSAVLGQELLVETDRSFDRVHPEGKVIRDVTPFSNLNQDRRRPGRVTGGASGALSDAVFMAPTVGR